MATPEIQNGGVSVMAAAAPAIRSELDGNSSVGNGFGHEWKWRDIKQLMEKCHFLRSIYKHHSNAEDEVIFPALDIRVKNVARTYSLEHEGESLLFDQLFSLLDNDTRNEESYKRELASCTGALQNINQSAYVQGRGAGLHHPLDARVLPEEIYRRDFGFIALSYVLCSTWVFDLSRSYPTEDSSGVLNRVSFIWQVFPLLNEKFSFEEQASLVWQFLCSIPVNMMAEFLPWLSSSISPDERLDMRKCLNRIIPDEKLLQQVRCLD
ncbi:UNVERIFIED_CONTAM: Zinc finger protein BRUTUS [Sesamum angustifolium]|uniref:Zinc finger protein BRUTUS n=1 Tax=Sesamum angustifolium TaxID=2727405 RepID=A0AAW2M741_9LAMI